MSNLLAKTARAIPYNGFLRPICKSVTSAILFQQLEYWFDKQDDKFYKFLEPCKNTAYKEGDSWIEELSFSKDEFRGAFDNIGVRYSSKKEYDLCPDDKFQGMFYLSYHDKIKGMTWYMRNNELIEKTINEICKPTVNRKSQSTDKSKADSCKSEKSIYVNSESQFTEIGKVNSDYTEITTEITTKKEKQTQPSYQEKELEIELPKIKSLSEQLQELAEKNNIPYTDDVRQDNNFHSKLMLEIKNCTNEKILERATQFVAIAKRDKKPSWVLTNKLGFKTLKFKWDDIEMEYKAGKAHNAYPRPVKVEETLYDASRAGIVPSLEELQRMYSDV